jgi:excisionase family DNA binding protein
MTDPELLSLRSAAELLGITPDTLRAQIHRGRLTAIKLGRDWLVRRDEVARYAAARRRERRAGEAPA